MSQKIRPDLKEIIHLGAAGHIDLNHFERWQQFKGLWSTEDRALWQTLLSRVHKEPDGTAELYPPLSDDEKVWAKDLLQRAEALSLC
jgi:hypothetical protein